MTVYRKAGKKSGFILEVNNGHWWPAQCGAVRVRQKFWFAV
jgi:hypothetical protein